MPGTDFSGRLGLRVAGRAHANPNLWADFFFLRGETSSRAGGARTVRSELDDKSGWWQLPTSPPGVEFGGRTVPSCPSTCSTLTDKEYIASTENLYGAERSVAIRLSLNW